MLLLSVLILRSIKSYILAGTCISSQSHDLIGSTLWANWNLDSCFFLNSIGLNKYEATCYSNYWLSLCGGVLLRVLTSLFLFVFDYANTSNSLLTMSYCCSFSLLSFSIASAKSIIFLSPFGVSRLVLFSVFLVDLNTFLSF